MIPASLLTRTITLLYSLGTQLTRGPHVLVPDALRTNRWQRPYPQGGGRLASVRHHWHRAFDRRLLPVRLLVSADRHPGATQQGQPRRRDRGGGDVAFDRHHRVACCELMTGLET